MLIYPVEVLIVSKIDFKFTYKPLKGARKIYAKDYDTEKPKEIKKEQLTPVPFNSSVTVLLKYRNKYYWCNQFEECYKDYKGTGQNLIVARKGLIERTTLTFKTVYPTLRFESKHLMYETNDIKLIKIKDENN